MKQHRILYGVCGIGNGHAYRQLPIIEDLALDNKVVIFTYGNGLNILGPYFRNNKHITIMEVAVPYYPGTTTGLDFDAAADLSTASGVDHVTVNARAMAEAMRLIGTPDLVISDYEPVCAQYAYAYGSPLMTIDQQSKYLYGDFPDEIAGQRYIDEVMRLRMFFPAADTRIACSFFRVRPRQGAMEVLVVPPVLRRSVLDQAADQQVDNEKKILVYLTSQSGFEQPLPQLLHILGAQSDSRFVVYTAEQDAAGPVSVPGNVSMGRHGAGEFNRTLMSCSGVITTAGHSLLSEAMHLDLPVFALPLKLYEQQMNAAVIANNGFGVTAPKVTADKLQQFINNLDQFAKNIRDDTVILNRGNGTADIVACIRNKLNRSQQEVNV